MTALTTSARISYGPETHSHNVRVAKRVPSSKARNDDELYLRIGSK